MKFFLRTLIFSVVLLMFTWPVLAQNAIAKIKYEQAEEAFIINDYVTTITRLNEAEKILGASNPKILYLRIMAEKGIISAGNYDYEFLTLVRKNTEYYIKNYSEIEGIEGKFREVYDFSGTLENLPATKALFDQKLAEAAQKRAEWAKSRPLVVSDSLITAYRVKKSSTVQEFMAYNPGAFAGLEKSKYAPKGFLMYLNTNMLTGPSSVVFNATGLQSYSYVVQGLALPDVAKKVYQTFLDLYPVGPENSVELKEISEIGPGLEMGVLMIKSPATGNRGLITISYSKFPGGGAKVEISFYPQQTTE